MHWPVINATIQKSLGQKSSRNWNTAPASSSQPGYVLQWELSHKGGQRGNENYGNYLNLILCPRHLQQLIIKLLNELIHIQLICLEPHKLLVWIGVNKVNGNELHAPV